jgi:cytosine/adenosine deaminase-related metal-dependent hydrolase
MNVFLSGGKVLCPTRDFEPFAADIEIENGKIKALHEPGFEPIDPVIRRNCHGCHILPGFVQAHVHLAQALFRGLGEGLRLLDWLTQRVLPLEAAHDEQTLYASARFGIAELLLNGCTTLLDMGSVRHMTSIYEAARDSGIRLIGGKILMDRGEAPPALIQDTDAALDEALTLIDAWHLAEDGRIRAALAPRFLLSCTDALMRETLKTAAKRDLVWHTHVAEQVAEIDVVRAMYGRRSLELIDDWGGADARLCLAHMVHVTDSEMAMANKWRIGILHCPSANTRLGSGVCPVPRWQAEGHPVGLGSDGSACNNRLDMITEMRAAAALQDLAHEPGALSGRTLLRMATLDGARALGIDDHCGSVTVGKRADLLVMDLETVQGLSAGHPADAIVHNADGRCVRDVLVDGNVLVSEGRLTDPLAHSILPQARKAMDTLILRAGLNP